MKFRFYRQCRLWHGYLSAFAFTALLFFAGTGLLLNHPDWFTSEAPPLEESTLALTPEQLEEVRQSQTPGERLASIVAEQGQLYGEYKDGALVADQVFVRLQGARGSSDIRLSLTDGSVAIAVEKATTIALLNALHRGEVTGTAWRMVIDVAAVVLIALALVGYAIFFSMSGKLRTTLALTASSIVGAIALFLAVK
ncbi:MAG TPA: PepSY-associated TM helix domain-containing protein [Steroidobacteraceae bacterium]